MLFNSQPLDDKYAEKLGIKSEDEEIEFLNDMYSSPPLRLTLIVRAFFSAIYVSIMLLGAGSHKVFTNPLRCPVSCLL